MATGRQSRSGVTGDSSNLLGNSVIVCFAKEFTGELAGGSKILTKSETSFKLESMKLSLHKGPSLTQLSISGFGNEVGYQVICFANIFVVDYQLGN